MFALCEFTQSAFAIVSVFSAWFLWLFLSFVPCLDRENPYMCSIYLPNEWTNTGTIVTFRPGERNTVLGNIYDAWCPGNRWKGTWIRCTMQIHTATFFHLKPDTKTQTISIIPQLDKNKVAQQQ